MDDFALPGRRAKLIVRRCEIRGERFFALGRQVEAVLGLLTAALPPCEWYGSGLRVNGNLPPALAGCREASPARIGDGGALRAGVGAVEQFLRGRLVALAAPPDGAAAPLERRLELASIEFVNAERMDLAATDAAWLDAVARAFGLRMDVRAPEPQPAAAPREVPTDPVANLQRTAGWLSPLLIVLGVLSIIMVIVQTAFALPALPHATPGMAALLLVGILTSLAFAVAELGLGVFVASTASAVKTHVPADGHAVAGDASRDAPGDAQPRQESP